MLLILNWCIEYAGVVCICCMYWISMYMYWTDVLHVQDWTGVMRIGVLIYWTGVLHVLDWCVDVLDCMVC